MDLILPDFGLLVWTGLTFSLLFFLLAKFAWKPILNSVNAREQKISEALELAEKTKTEMQALKAENDQILKDARKERDLILSEAKDASLKMIDDAKAKAKDEAVKIVEAARQNINSEKAAAMAELKNHMASLSLEMAEKVVLHELGSDDKQKALATQLAGEIKMN